MAPAMSTASLPLIHLKQHLKMHPLLSALLTNVFSWRTLAILLALINLKSLPLAWHLRLITLTLKHGRNLRHILSHLKRASSNSIKATQNRIHPIFRPVSILSWTSLYETDYNFHKSNSTYFADLDHSRTALVASLLGPTLAHSTLKEHGEKPGVIYPILGSVHTSFLREIKPLEAYTVRSRLLGWDRKWMIIVTDFLRSPTKKERAKAKKEGKELGDEILLACALNKYVLKRGRKTIDPGLALAASGWFQARTGITHAIGSSTAIDAGSKTRTATLKDGDSSAVTSGSSTPLPAPSQTSVSAAETIGKVVRRLSSSGDNANKPNLSITSSPPPSSPPVGDHPEELGGWSWAEINEERLRGLKVAEEWLKLDTSLRDEHNSFAELI